MVLQELAEQPELVEPQVQVQLQELQVLQEQMVLQELVEQQVQVEPQVHLQLQEQVVRQE
jgi:hypothetical protein